ncbi:ribonuclease HI family protein [Candidatus Gracilibacteria bacterium]|nr:ribonuclease HI family protein [Candidatus Gracilibacteria bacterium]MCF7856047.1 ribonuclease HI family protein [Candidatus Gracilibacteria bacterium]MCF7896398.1 ribonuclease HI family protein [Candidatus Gracilibacteria bacterium]
MKLTILSDGGARGNPGPAAAGAVLRNSTGETVGSFSQFLGDATNNQAEYFAALLGIQKAAELGAVEVEILLDSKLVVEQVAGRWKIKDLELKKLAEKIHAILPKFQSWKISHIPREKNREADALVNQVLDARGFKKTLFHGFR